MRVLLVEDDPTTSKSIEMMLTNANFNVYATDLGEEGIDLAKLYDYDLILLDLNLPDMDGHEVLRQLRVAKIKTPILILSGNDAAEDKVRSRQGNENQTYSIEGGNNPAFDSGSGIANSKVIEQH